MAHPSDYGIRMRYPDATPMQFSGAKAFVETHGNAVWIDLCDTFPTGEPIRLIDAAAKLSTLSAYTNPVRHLRAVLHAIITDYHERKDDYEHTPPFTVIGTQMVRIIL